MNRNLGYIWEPARFRPGLLQFVGCRGVRLEGVTFRDSAFWTVHLVGCERVDVVDLVVDNDLAVPVATWTFGRSISGGPTCGSIPPGIPVASPGRFPASWRGM
jgi:hypothetical protein